MAVVIDTALFTAELKAEVQKVLDTTGASGARVSGWEKIQSLLTTAKVAWTAQVPPEFVGVHPMNRSQLGVGGSEAHHHGAQILQAGWSWSKAADATAFEVPPAPHDEAAAQANNTYVSLADGLIPPLVQLKLLSVGGGHTNTFLRAVKAGCRSAVPKIADQTGALNLDALAVGRDEFRSAVQNGMKWFVLHWQCQYVWPGLVHFAQAALNTHARSEQSEIEVMLEMHAAVKAAVETGREVDWKRVQEAACFSLPACSPYISTLAQYVREHSGGTDGALLHELSEFHKAFACNEAGATRRLGSEFLGKLAAINFGVGQKFPHIVTACVETNLASPKVIDGVCKLLQQPQIAALTAKQNRDVVKDAEQFMKDARVVCRSLNVENGIRTRVVGKADIRCICFLVGRQGVVEQRQFTSIAEIAEARRVTNQSPLPRVQGCSLVGEC
jgi:hypothetical protein